MSEISYNNLIKYIERKSKEWKKSYPSSWLAVMIPRWIIKDIKEDNLKKKNLAVHNKKGLVE